MHERAGFLAIVTGLLIAASTNTALPASGCGNTAAGFSTWVQQIRQEAAAHGMSSRTLAALDTMHYAQATIHADRNQHSFRLDLKQFMQKRGAAAIITRGRTLKKQHAALFARIEQRYSVPAGPLLAIWGMETAFGTNMGRQHILSAVATLAYDCRRADFFRNQLYALLQLIERGDFDPRATGAMHGEIGQTQFLPFNVLQYGVDEDGDGHVDMMRSPADALASTASFLRGHGWQRHAGYQPGEPNFAAIQAWNRASVYQQAIAWIGKKIDGL